MLPLDERTGKIVVDMQIERIRELRQSSVRRPSQAVRRSAGWAEKLEDRLWALLDATACRLADLGASLQQRGRPGAWLGDWLSGFLQPQGECR